MGEFTLKSIHKDTVPSALEKAEWYRALHEPLEAESICRDVLAVEPDHQKALAMLLLSLTDQFPRGLQERYREARKIVEKLTSEYEREYYSGILCERRAKCQYHQGTPGSGHVAYQGLRKAMAHYEKAEKLRPAGNDDAALRWNTCARIIMTHRDIVPEPEAAQAQFELE